MAYLTFEEQAHYGKHHRRHVLVIILLLVAVSGVIVVSSMAQPFKIQAAQAGTSFDYVLSLIMENIPPGMGNSCCPFYTSLLNSWAVAANYEDTSKIGASCSLPNYVALTSGIAPVGGIVPGFPGCDPGCDSYSCPNLAATNIVDRIEAAGLSWKAYMEDYPGGCRQSGVSGGHYGSWHNPFNYYIDIATNSTRCAKIVPANTVVSSSQETDSRLLSDLGSTATASNYMWLTPNLLDDMHDSNQTFGDGYLALMVPKILATSVFQTQKAVLQIFFDEGSSNIDIFAGRVAKQSYVSSSVYNHYSNLRTIESNWGLLPLTSNDAGASVMSEFFTNTLPPPLSASFTFSPANPMVNQAAVFTVRVKGGFLPYSYSWNFGDGGTAKTNSTSHSYATFGTFRIVLIVTDSLSSTVTVTQNITVSTASGGIGGGGGVPPRKA